MTFPAPTPNLRTLLLFPRHLSPTPDTIPLLKSLQTLLNLSFTHGYCSKCPEICGASVTRLADPTKFKDFIREDGFTIALFTNIDGDNGGLNTEIVAELVATVSVRVIDEEVARMYSQWAGWGWAAKSSGAGIVENYTDMSSRQAEILQKFQMRIQEWKNQPPVYEACVQAASPKYQGSRLGARVVGLCQWLVGDEGMEMLKFARSAGKSGSGVEASLSTAEGTVRGIDVDELRRVFESREVTDGEKVERGFLSKEASNCSNRSLSRLRATRSVIVVVRKLDREELHRKQGMKMVGTGVLPVGTWDNKVECSVAFLEQDLR